MFEAYGFLHRNSIEELIFWTPEQVVLLKIDYSARCGGWDRWEPISNENIEFTLNFQCHAYLTKSSLKIFQERFAFHTEYKSEYMADDLHVKFAKKYIDS